MFKDAGLAAPLAVPVQGSVEAAEQGLPGPGGLVADARPVRHHRPERRRPTRSTRTPRSTPVDPNDTVGLVGLEHQSTTSAAA